MSIRLPMTISNHLCKKYELLPWHIEFIQYLMLPKALRPPRSYIEKKFNLTTNVYYYWLRNPKINSARKEFVKEYYKDDIPDVLLAMKDEAISGNPIAAKLFLEYVDDWNKDKNNDNDEEKLIIPRAEVKIIIQNLTNKFYGTEKQQLRGIEIEAEPELSGSALSPENEAGTLPVEVDEGSTHQDLPQGNRSE